MAWTTPRTWVDDEVVEAVDLNTHIRDNLAYVHSGKPATGVARSNGSAYTTSSTSFVDVDGTNLSITLSVTTGRVLVAFTATIYADSSAGRLLGLDVKVNGTRQGGSDGLCKEALSADARVISFTKLLTGLAAGSHTITLQWKIGNGTASMFSDSAVAVHFSAIEL